jgi:hypothetical protein
MAYDKTGKWVNDLTDIPAAACGVCGGWTGYGGMSQYEYSDVPEYGRTGCVCYRLKREYTDADSIR